MSVPVSFSPRHRGSLSVSSPALSCRSLIAISSPSHRHSTPRMRLHLCAALVFIPASLAYRRLSVCVTAPFVCNVYVSLNEHVSCRAQITSSILHGTGLIMSAFGAYPLLRSAHDSQDTWHFWGITVYLCALLAMYASTTLGHSFFMYTSTANMFRKLDHSATYLLIAGAWR